MSLTQLVKDSVNTAFTATGDLKTTIFVRYKTAGSFNSTTLSKSYTNNDVEVKDCFVGKFQSIKDDQVPILPLDRKVTINASKLTTRPNVKDAVVIGGQEYEIVADRSGVGDFVYVLQVRANVQ